VSSTSPSTATEVSYGSRVTQIAGGRPDNVDLVIIGRDGFERGVSWRELETRSNQIAHRLVELGAGKGSVVALALATCAEHVFVTIAIWKLGGTVLPLRHDMPQWEMDRLLDIAEPALLVTEQHDASCPVLGLSALAVTDTISPEPPPDAISDCINWVASSGSTGKPKLIVAAERGVVATDPTLAAIRGNASITLVTSPLYHLNGFAYTARGLLEGCRVYVMEKFDAAQFVELVPRYGIELTVMVPTMLQRVARLPEATPDKFSSIKRLIYGGATVPEWVVDRWLELIEPEAFLFTYGSSERLGFAVMTGAEWPDHRGSTGKVMGAELSVRDANGNPVPTGEVGEIFMRPTAEGPTFAYLGMPTPEPTPDGFRSVGDLGYLDDDGYLYIADRRTDMIITGGANVFPAEVESALSEHPGVIDQVVVPVPDDEWGHRVHAIIQPADAANPPTSEELRAWCKERLASYKAPKTYEIVDRVPRTEAGKVNRTNLGEDRGAT